MALPLFDLKVGAPGQRQLLTGLVGCAEALVLARLARRRRVVVLARDAGAAVRLVEQLAGLLDPATVHHLVGWEVLPYDTTSPPRATVSERVAAFASLNQGRGGVYVTAVTDALLPCMPQRRLGGHAMRLAVGDRINLASLAANLAAAGCANVDRVRAAGEFALYGGQLDLYPGGERQPYRLVLDDDTISQVRTFDPRTQLSTGQCATLEILPAREYPLDDESVAAFRLRWRERFAPGRSEELYARISRGEEAEGAEFFLPMFYGELACLFDYLGRRDVLWLQDGLAAGLEEFANLVQDRHTEACLAGQAALVPAEVFLTATDLQARLANHPVFEVGAATRTGALDMGTCPLPPLAASPGAAKPYARLAAWLAGQPGRIVFPWSGAARHARVAAALVAVASPATTTSTVGGRQHGCFLLESRLTGGFRHPAAGLAVVSEEELHGYVPAPRSLSRVAANVSELLGDLVPGTLVVHQDHGMARFHGLEVMVNDECEDEFIALEFANEVKLYVAVADCHLVARHRQPEPGEEVKLHTLGGSRWQRQRAKAAQVARDTAAHLLDIYARRVAAGGRPPAVFDEDSYASFCATFPYAETVDQVRATAEVVADQVGGEPMDRLICGDVGFGKTEVAMRAAWVAWSSGSQVVVIAPTTLLASQLHAGFVERFAGTPARIVELSSLRSVPERAATLAQLAAGTADIAVGTHALLGCQVRIPRLGLVVIDEEHRFGVRQKEHLRKLRAKVDVLALSATPIPRSLSMALEGLRDMSLLATPPADRLAVRTFVTRDGDAVMREGLAREFARGGQSFVVHHRVQTIRSMAERVSDLLPQATVVVAHGQLPHKQLEAVMRRYYGGEIDVLVCTTIIESGIDVPNANTMIVPRADMFGLAQLHQLRGRVGRAARQAYAYFLTPGNPARQGSVASRLETLVASSQLGGGHYIAARDLEIRGAGELLGDAQSGAVTAVGFETFRHLLAAATRAADGGELVTACQVDFGAHARLPARYCSNPVERMRMYRRLAAAADDEAVGALRAEMADRFGPLPGQVRLLLDGQRLRLRAAVLGISRVEATVRSVRLRFVPQPVCVTRLLDLVRERSGCQLLPDNSLRLDNEADMAGQMQLALEVCGLLAASPVDVPH